ncbi:MAG: hypothetical protein Q8N06_03620 [Hydrogenophaga sp.]|nr:hypothetical protein [Hydrogenophaga sp.]
MNAGMGNWWDPLAALAAIVLPLLLAWWLVVRGVQRPKRKKRESVDNPQHRSKPP